MKRSEAAIGYVLFSKAAELTIDPILFSSTINYIITNPKQGYDKTDISPAIHQFVRAIDEHLKINAAVMKPIFRSLDKQDYVKTAIMHFAERYRTNNFIDFIFQRCKNEIKAVIDYREMVDTGFSEQDLLNRIEEHL
jgi:hypothetical protein